MQIEIIYTLLCTLLTVSVMKTIITIVVILVTMVVLLAIPSAQAEHPCDQTKGAKDESLNGHWVGSTTAFIPREGYHHTLATAHYGPQLINPPSDPEYNYSAPAEPPNFLDPPAPVWAGDAIVDKNAIRKHSAYPSINWGWAFRLFDEDFWEISMWEDGFPTGPVQRFESWQARLCIPTNAVDGTLFYYSVFVHTEPRHDPKPISGTWGKLIIEGSHSETYD